MSLEHKHVIFNTSGISLFVSLVHCVYSKKQEKFKHKHKAKSQFWHGSNDELWKQKKMRKWLILLLACTQSQMCENTETDGRNKQEKRFSENCFVYFIDVKIILYILLVLPHQMKKKKLHSAKTYKQTNKHTYYFVSFYWKHLEKVVLPVHVHRSFYLSLSLSLAVVFAHLFTSLSQSLFLSLVLILHISFYFSADHFLNILLTVHLYYYTFTSCYR